MVCGAEFSAFAVLTADDAALAVPALRASKRGTRVFFMASRPGRRGLYFFAVAGSTQREMAIKLRATVAHIQQMARRSAHRLRSGESTHTEGEGNL